MKKFFALVYVMFFSFGFLAFSYTIEDQKNPDGTAFKWNVVGIGIPDSLSSNRSLLKSDLPKAIIIMDRNLGATMTGAGTGADPKSFGYHYQWGNNYGFDSTKVELEAKVLSKNKVDVKEGTKEYDGKEFVWGQDNYNWMIIKRDTLWSGESQQGPCPKGWHVPKLSEWNQLLNYYVDYYNSMNNSGAELLVTESDGLFGNEVHGNTGFLNSFINFFNLPYAGSREYSHARLMSNSAGYWSTTSPGSISARVLSFSFETVTTLYSSRFSDGSSIRCFKDYDDSDFEKLLSDPNVIKANISEKKDEKTSNGNSKNTTNSNKQNGNKSLEKTVNKIGKFEGYLEGDQNEVLENGFTREMNNAYIFGNKYGITSMKSIENADMNGELTRAAMAKMLSKFAKNVLNRNSDTTKRCAFADVPESLDTEYDNGITQACQYWIMGIGVTNFDPSGTVTRDQFGTALSRLLYDTRDGSPYYKTHFEVLKSKGIMNNTDPEKIEKRGNVLLMLMRSVL